MAPSSLENRPRRRYYEKRLKVLVADDNAHNRDICSEILRDDYLVLVAVDGAEAVETAIRERPSVILMDLMMPGLDGIEACRLIKQNARLRDTPIIILSAKGMTDDIVAGLTVAEDYIVKPFEIRELLARVRSMTRLKSAQDHIRILNTDLELLIQKRTEQLLERQKLAIVGQYAAGVVHNLSGALQKVMTSLELARRGGDRVDSYLGTALDGANDMRDIVSTILDKGRNEQRLDTTKVNLNAVLTAAVRFWDANPEFKHNVEKQLDLDPDLPDIESVYAHWSQSIDNLVSNALEAMRATEQKRLRLRTRARRGKILLQVSDSGQGMDNVTVGKIFDPFFTTKSDGRGTGLGLASVVALLEPYGVSIKVDSTPGKGTTFSLELPIPADRPQAKDETTPPPSRRIRRGSDIH